LVSTCVVFNIFFPTGNLSLDLQLRRPLPLLTWLLTGTFFYARSPWGIYKKQRFGLDGLIFSNCFFFLSRIHFCFRDVSEPNLKWTLTQSEITLISQRPLFPLRYSPFSSCCRALLQPQNTIDPNLPTSSPSPFFARLTASVSNGFDFMSRHLFPHSRFLFETSSPPVLNRKASPRLSRYILLLHSQPLFQIFFPRWQPDRIDVSFPFP